MGLNVIVIVAVAAVAATAAVRAPKSAKNSNKMSGIKKKYYGNIAGTGLYVNGKNHSALI